MTDNNNPATVDELRAHIKAMDPADAKEYALGIIALGKHLVKMMRAQVDPRVKVATEYMEATHLKPGETARAHIEGREVATVNRSQVGEKWTITDETAWATWLEETGREKNPWTMRPNERVTSAAYVKITKESLDLAGDGEIPSGISITDTGGTVSARFSAKQMAALDSLGATQQFSEVIAYLTDGTDPDTEEKTDE